MNIGEAASQSGVKAKTIRYYEDVGLLPKAARSPAGYRRYGDNDVATLRFVNRARGLGFSVRDVADLLALYHDRDRASADVKAVALAHIAGIERKLGELESMRRTLLDLTERCHGDARPDCPILDDLAGALAD